MADRITIPCDFNNVRSDGTMRVSLRRVPVAPKVGAWVVALEKDADGPGQDLVYNAEVLAVDKKTITIRPDWDEEWWEKPGVTSEQIDAWMDTLVPVEIRSGPKSTVRISHGSNTTGHPVMLTALKSTVPLTFPTTSNS